MKTSRFLATTIAAACVLLSPAANAQYVYSSDAQWGSWSDGSWIIYNDAWGVTDYSEYPQTLNITSINQWNVQTSQVGGGVKTSPNTVVVPNTPLSEMAAASASFSLQSPSGSEYDWIFDAYTTSGGADQIQIYESWTTPTGGWGNEIYTNVTIGQSTWSQVWQEPASDNGGDNVLMFFRSGQRTSGYEDILAIVNWCASKGLLQDQTFYSMSFGPEITNTNGLQSFYLNDYAAVWSNTSGGGSGITPSTYLIPNGTYVITNKNSGRTIDDYENSTTEGTDIDQWAADGGTNQEWTLSNLGNNYVTLTSVKSGMSVEVKGASKSNGAAIDQWPDDGGTNQIWHVVSEGGGYYELIDENSGLALEVPSLSKSNGTDLDQWTPNGGANQLWSF